MQNRIYVNYGSDPKAMAYELMAEADIGALVSPDMRIALKPNLVVAKPASSGATTHSELLAGVIEYLFERGCKKIEIIEGAWVGASTQAAFRAAGYEALSKTYGVPLFDTKRDQTSSRSYAGLAIDVCNKALNADFLINMPVLKAHCQTTLTCALKNLKGCISDAQKRRFHALGLHKPIAVLNKLLKQHLIIVDALNGDLSFEEGGTPVEMGRALLCDDPVLVDSYACELMGVSIDEVEYMPLSAQYGVGRLKNAATEIVELNADRKPKANPSLTRGAQALARYAQQDQACSACYGSLIHALHRLDARKLKSLPPLYIGQGFRGKSGRGLGIGRCASGFSEHVGGCPPTAQAILDKLTGLL